MELDRIVKGARMMCRVGASSELFKLLKIALTELRNDFTSCHMPTLSQKLNCYKVHWFRLKNS